MRRFDARAAEDERGDRPVTLELVVTGEFAPELLILAKTRVELAEAHRVLAELSGRAATAPLPFEQLAEAALVHREAGRGRDLLGHLERKAVRVGKPERRIGIYPLLALRARTSDRLVDHRQALRERPLELLLFLEDDLGDAIASGRQLVVVPLHHLHDLAAELRERARPQAKAPAVHRRAADYAAKHIPPELVRRRDAVRDEERRGPRVLGHDAYRHVGRRRGAVLLSRERLDLLHERLEHVAAINVAGYTLKHLRQPLETRAGVDVLLRERNERAVGLAVVLLEDKVPDLEVPPAVLGRAALVLGHTGLRTSIEKDLAVRAREPGQARRPEVLRIALTEDLLRRKQLQHLRPDLVGLVVGVVDCRDEL